MERPFQGNDRCKKNIYEVIWCGRKQAVLSHKWAIRMGANVAKRSKRERILWQPRNPKGFYPCLMTSESTSSSRSWDWFVGLEGESWNFEGQVVAVAENHFKPKYTDVGGVVPGHVRSRSLHDCDLVIERLQHHSRRLRKQYSRSTALLLRSWQYHAFVEFWADSRSPGHCTVPDSGEIPCVDAGTWH